jgi:hypothetical protein
MKSEKQSVRLWRHLDGGPAGAWRLGTPTRRLGMRTMDGLDILMPQTCGFRKAIVCRASRTEL